MNTPVSCDLMVSDLQRVDRLPTYGFATLIDHDWPPDGLLDSTTGLAENGRNRRIRLLPLRQRAEV